MTEFVERIGGERKRAADIVKSHPLVITFAVCLFLCAVSQMEQYAIDGGGLVAIFLALVALSFCASAYLGADLGLKSPIIAVIFVSFVALSFWATRTIAFSERKPAAILILCALALIIIAVYLLVTKNMSAERAVALIFVFTIFLRFSYVSITSITTRCHDVVNYAGTDDPFTQGHMGYILYLFKNGFALPDVITGENLFDQAYHPPLHHFIAAVWLKIMTAFGVETDLCYSSIQTLTLFYSLVSTVYAYKILLKFKMSDGVRVALFAVVAFHPSFIYMAADVNNDMLSVALMFVAFYHALGYRESGSTKEIVFTALAVGAAMMAKLSAYMICVPIAVVFSMRFFGLVREKKKVNGILKQFAIFLAICAPLALFFPMRNMIKYGLPLTFVQRLPENSWQYVGNYSVTQRLFDFRSMFTDIYDQWKGRGADFHDFNPLVCLIKTSVFEEYINAYGGFAAIDLWAHVIYFANISIIAFSLVGAAYLIAVAIRKRRLRVPETAVGAGYVFMLAAYYVFCFAYPHHCTENMRYVTPLILYGEIFIGSAFDVFDENAEGKAAAKVAGKTAKTLFYVAAVLFSLASFGMVVKMIKA